VAVDERQQVSLYCQAFLSTGKLSGLCYASTVATHVVYRDALAVLRRQYGLENSPRKRRQDTSHHNKQNGLALEQVTIV